MKKSKTIVLIHGLFVNNTSWTEWKNYFEAKGYTVYTPANPSHEGDPAELRNNPRPILRTASFEDLVKKLADFIDTLSEKPIVIGHSLGGLATMKLVELGKAYAGVSIDGAPPKNVFAPLSTIKIVAPVMNPFAGRSPFMGSKEWYHKAFFNHLSKAESDKAWEQIAVPESRTVARDTLLKPFAKVDFNKPHVPLLFIGGEKDNIFSANFTKKIAGRYTHKASKLDLKVFENRTHFIAGQEGWQEVADYVLDWIERL